MSALLLWLLFAPPAADKTPPGANPDVSYKTSKSLPALETCLYGELSELGEATFMRSAGETILMIRNGEGPPVLVDITPPKVAITTKASLDVRRRVKRCV